MLDDNEVLGGESADSRLIEALAAYLQAVESGHSPNREEFFREFPGREAEIAEFLDGDAALRSMSDGAPPETSRRFGDYELVSVIGRGGMGIVYKARQISLNRFVALKMILGGRLASEEDAMRFRREAEALAKLDHPHIVPIHEVGEFEGNHYFSMRLIETTGARPTRADGPRGAAILTSAVAMAIHHAHERGVLHLDLKPSNILVDEEERPQITDFGLARYIGQGKDLTATGAVYGTLGYMAPEQANGERADATEATDIHGLGAVLYALLTGRPPYKRDSVFETLERTREGNPTPLRQILPKIDRAIEAICLKCLDKDPSRRYSSALEVAEDLDRYLRGEPPKARPLSRLDRAKRWARQNRKRITAAAGSLLVAGLLSFGVWQAMRVQNVTEVAQRSQDDLREKDLQIRRYQYVQDLERAKRSIHDGNATEAESFLDAHLPAPGTEDLRGFEWYYLRRQTHAEGFSWVAHGGREVYHVEYAPDGRSLVSSGEDKVARIWDAATGRELQALKGHTSDVNWASFDQAGKRVVTASEDGTVRLWSAEDGRQIGSFEGFKREAVAALFTPGGRDVIAGARNGEIRRWDAKDGRLRAKVDPYGPWLGQEVSLETMAVSPKGTTLAVGGRFVAGPPDGKSAILYDLSAGGLVSTGIAPNYCSGFGLAFSPDGTTLAATSNGRHQAFLFDPKDAEPRIAFENTGAPAYSLAFAPDGKTLAVASEGVLRLWDIAQQKCRAAWLGHNGRIYSAAFAPDGQSVATAGRDGTIRIWSATRYPDRVVFRGPEPEPGRSWGDTRASSIAFSEDGTKVLVSNRAGDVQECVLADGRARWFWKKDPYPVSCFSVLSPDGNALAVYGPTIPTGSKLPGRENSMIVTVHPLDGSAARKLPGFFKDSRPSWSPDGTRLALKTPEGDLTLWNAADGTLIARTPAKLLEGSSLPSFSPLGDRLFVYSGGKPDEPQDHFIEWKPPSTGFVRRNVPLKEPGRNFGKVIVSPDGRDLVTTKFIIDQATLRWRYDLAGHDDQVMDVAISPDGKTIATASADRTVRLWSVAGGREYLVLEGHTNHVEALAFSPDGQSLASVTSHSNYPSICKLEVIVWRADEIKRPAR